MLRRKATAALSAFRPETMRQKQPPAPEPIWASAHLQRALSAPGLRAPRPRPRSSPFAPQYTEAVAFGKRATLPNMATPSPVANASSVEYFAMSRPPSAFLAMSHPAGARSARTAPSPGGMTPIDHAITPMGSAHLPSQGGGVHTPAAGAGRRASTAVPGSRPGRGSVASPAFGDGSRGVDMGAGAAGAATCACAGAFEVGDVGGLIAPNFVGLSDEVDEISERLAQVERVTSMMTPAYTVELQKRLKQSFQRIDEVLGHTDVLLLTEQQKRQVQAATAIQARIRTFVLRKRYVRGAHALRTWASRELQEVCAQLVALLRKCEQQDETVMQHRAEFLRKHTSKLLTEWRRLAVEGLAARVALDSELRARRHYRRAFLKRVLWAWKQVAHFASLREVRWVTRGHRRVALPKEIVDTLEGHLRAWRTLVYVSVEARKRFGVCGRREISTAFYALRELVRRRKRLRSLTIERWKDYCRSYWQLPFRAWYLYVLPVECPWSAR